jgi:hypothetical protein
MKKQTAVELLMESIDSEMKSGTKMVVNWDIYLAMEKEQTMQFAEDFIDWSTDIDPSIYDSFKEAINDYYNKTYTP